jgi:hypothetical protein
MGVHLGLPLLCRLPSLLCLRKEAIGVSLGLVQEELHRVPHLLSSQGMIGRSDSEGILRRAAAKIHVALARAWARTSPAVAFAFAKISSAMLA